MNRILERPLFYEINQRNLLTKELRKKITNFLKEESHGLENHHVLDIGCGTGLYMNVFGERCLGTDINLRYLRFIKKSNHNIFNADAVCLPVKDCSFGFVFCINVFHHLEDYKIKKVLDEMWRVCMPGGKLFISDVVHSPIRTNMLGWFLRKLDRGNFIRKREHFKDIFNDFNSKVRGEIRFIDFKAYPHDNTITIINKKTSE